MDGQFPFEHFLKFPNEDKEKSNNINALDLGFEAKEEPAQAAEMSSDAFNQEELNHINEQILCALKTEVPLIKFNTFFSHNFTLISITDDEITFAVTTTYIRDIINNHYLENVKNCVSKVLGKEFNIKIQVVSSQQSLSSNSSNILNSINENKTESLTEEVNHNTRGMSAKNASFTLDLIPTNEDKMGEVKSKVINHINSSQYGFVLDPKKTFETFVVGPSNNMAYASAQAVARNPGKVYPSLYFHSNSGLGKTHLLHAVANKIKEDHPSLIIFFTTARDFMSEMVDAMANKKIAEFRKKYSESIDVLMIDDVHELKNKQGTQNEFFHVFNELHNKGKQLIFTSDKHPKDIDGIEERIKTRLTWGLVLDIQPPDIETRTAILKRKAQEEDIYISHEVINLIAAHVKSNIRELESALIRLTAYASVFNVDIDSEIAREQLNISEFNCEVSITADAVVKKVSAYYGVHMADVKSRTRMKDVTNARHVSMYLIHHLVKLTLAEIGEFFSGRDHTTVMHAIDKIKKRSQTDQVLQQALLDIENSLA